MQEALGNCSLSKWTSKDKVLGLRASKTGGSESLGIQEAFPDSRTSPHLCL